jgi:hypothetical protein
MLLGLLTQDPPTSIHTAVVDGYNLERDTQPNSAQHSLINGGTNNTFAIVYWDNNTEFHRTFLDATRQLPPTFMGRLRAIKLFSEASKPRITCTINPSRVP